MAAPALDIKAQRKTKVFRDNYCFSWLPLLSALLLYSLNTSVHIHIYKYIQVDICLLNTSCIRYLLAFKCTVL